MLEDCGERSVPILITHGTAAPLVPFDEVQLGKVCDSSLALGASEVEAEMFGMIDLPMSAYVEAWASHNGCDTDLVASDLCTEVTVVEYKGCDSGADVVFQIVDGGGHAWPGTPLPESRSANLGYATVEIDATAEALAFFGEHPLPLKYLQS